MPFIKHKIQIFPTTKLLKKFNCFERHFFNNSSQNRPSIDLKRATTLALLREFFVDELNWPLSSTLEIKIRHHPSGEPYISHPKEITAPLLHISISHSGPWIAFILSDKDNPTGLDIEDISKNRKVQELSDYAFSKEEQEYVKKYGALGFYYLWGAKEAFAKLRGKGLTFALKTNLKSLLTEPSKNEITKSSVQIQGKQISFHHTVSNDLLITTAREQGS